jgi:hypothetical protein
MTSEHPADRPFRRAPLRVLAMLVALGAIVAVAATVGSAALARNTFYDCSGGAAGTPNVTFQSAAALTNQITVSASVDPHGAPTVVEGWTLQVLRTNFPGEDNDLVFTGTSVDESIVAISMTAPETPLSPLSVIASGSTITVGLGTDAAGHVSSTAQDVMNLINNDPGAKKLVVATIAPGNGTGLGRPANLPLSSLIQYYAGPLGVEAGSVQTVQLTFTDLQIDTPYSFVLQATNECPLPTPNSFATAPSAPVQTSAQAGIHVAGSWGSAPADPKATITGTVTVAPDPAGSGSGTTVTCTGSIGYAGTLATPVDGKVCDAAFTSGTSITLTATPAPGSYFLGWVGPDCGAWGARPVCYTTTVGALDDIAIFTNRPQLTVSYAGNGDGTVTSAPAGINCTFTTELCGSTFVPGTAVTLTEKPATGGAFLGWGGDGIQCGVAPTCTVVMTADLAVSVSFAGKPTLMVFRAGDGDGTVTSSTSEINCSDTSAKCTSTYGFGTQVVLTATPADGSTFAGWGTDMASCAGTSPTCTITASFSQTITAIFSAGDTLSVTPSGTGSGVVTSSPSGVSCPPACASVFPDGSAVTLSVAPLSGSTFAGWDDGPCFDRDAAAPCTVTLVDDMDIPVLFNNPSVPTLTAKSKQSYKGCTIVGTSRNDVLVGTSGHDVICGGGGNDTLIGMGNDVLLGGAGNDRLICNGSCKMYGGAGNDTLIAKGSGYSQLFGGPGNDTLLAHNNARNVLDGGAGRNTARFDKGLDVLKKIQRKL